MSRVLLCPGPHQVLPNPPALPLRSGGFLVRARSLSESGRVVAALMPRVRHRSEAVDIDHGQLGGRHLSRFAIAMDLHELAPVCGRATSRRHRRRCEWFTQVGENLPDRPGLWRNAISRMSPSPPGHSSGNSSPTRAISFAHAFPRGVMQTGLCMRVAAASGAVTVVSMPANLGLALRADIPFSPAP